MRDVAQQLFSVNCQTLDGDVNFYLYFNRFRILWSVHEIKWFILVIMYVPSKGPFCLYCFRAPLRKREGHFCCTVHL